jgi:hypothetical protein
MPAIGQTITHWQGDTRTISIGPVVDENGTLIDLTSAEARWWMGRSAKATGSDIFIMKKSGGQGITFNNTGGSWFVLVSLVPADTENVPPGNWYHECEVIDQFNNVARVTIGKFKLNQSLIPAALG